MAAQPTQDETSRSKVERSEKSSRQRYLSSGRKRSEQLIHKNSPKNRAKAGSGWHEAPDVSGKAPGHKAAQKKAQSKNVMRQPMHKETSSIPITPMKEIIILPLNTILEINRQIREMSVREPWIQYENRDDPVLRRKLEKLVEQTPNLDILEIAAYSFQLNKG